MSKAIFLDRDGTIILDKNYLADPEGVELLPGVREALVQLQAAGWRLFLFTNQSGVGRGYYGMDDVRRVNARMDALLDLPPPGFVETCVAPELPDEPAVYRKPSPRFILEMIDAYELDPPSCYMVGDKRSDVEAGLAAGIQAVAIRGGAPGTDEEWPEGVRVFTSLAAFAERVTGS